MKKLFAVVSVALASVIAQAATLPEKLRVLAVDLDRALIETPGVPGGEIAQQVRTLLENADPDVVCLQGVLDWETAERVGRLKPGFRLVTCSAFEAKNPNVPAAQVAILARDKAAISWVEEVSDNGGFAFAVLQAGSRKLGVFSVQSTLANSAASAPLTERILAEISKLQKFPQNRPDSFLVAGSALVKSSPIVEAGLQSISAEAPGAYPTSPIRAEFWVNKAGFIARPRAVAIKGLKAPAIVSDFDAGSSFSTKFAYQTPLLFQGESPASLQAAVTATPPEGRSLVWPVGIATAFLVLFLLVLLRRTPTSTEMALMPVNGNQQLGPTEKEQIRTGMLDWLKSAFLQRLLSQRQQMLNNEAEATRRTMVIEEKLSNLQNALQSRIGAYEARIERLEVELTAATSENRDLIRSQIDLLKEKVAKAKEERAYTRN
ncbi:MAG TPA: hypothetical protein VF773_06460 [Verrucomicrobiae bacterium]